MTKKPTAKTKKPTLLYGVVIDVRLPREDQGVPAFFDGWYLARSDAEGALAYFAAKSPGAHARLVTAED
jgi:hypothetical protein